MNRHADTCEADLKRVPDTLAGSGWLWSRANPPGAQDAPAPGKWMLFPTCADAVAAWRVVARAAADGQLWSAKIAPRALGPNHLICVYTPDFRDLSAVEQVAHHLNDLGLVHATMYYKPDVFTYAGIYSASSGSRRQQSSIYAYSAADRHLRATPALARANELLAQPSRQHR